MPTLFSFQFSAMASRCEVRLYAPDAARAQAWADAAMAEVRRIEAKYSRYRDDSVVSAINRAAGRAAVEVDAETSALLDFGDRLHTQSAGRFDLTSGVLRRAWNFKSGQLPAPEEVAALLPLIDWAGVRWQGERILLPRAGMEIDFGGIGKEYAADRAASAMLAQGADRGMVNLGGDVRVLGPAPDGAPWRIGIQDPRGEPGRTIAHLDVSTGAVATSGDYERYIEVDGRRYSHLLNPTTGWPVDHWRSISVVAPLAAAAGACATLAMLMPVVPALDLLRREAVRYFAIDAAGHQHAA